MTLQDIPAGEWRWWSLSVALLGLLEPRRGGWFSVAPFKCPHTKLYLSGTGRVPQTKGQKVPEFANINPSGTLSIRLTLSQPAEYSLGAIFMDTFLL
jgi:hypothetical protein